MGIAQAAITFQDVTGTAGPFHTGESWGAAWGDLNEDGRPDLHVNNHRHRDSIYRNNGDGTFSDVTLQADTSGRWLGNPNADTHGGSWADFDRDGDQDLSVSTGVCCPAYFFVNQGGVFVEQAADYGVNDDGGGRLPSWFDFNDDGLTDILMALIGPSRLWEQQAFTFVNRRSRAGLTCDTDNYALLSDLNNDRRVELICAPARDHFPGKVFDTSPPLPFTDITAILPATSLEIDTVSADFDGNLRPDLLVVRGGVSASEALRISPSRIEAFITGGGHEQGPSPGVDKGLRFTGSGPITIDIDTSQIALPEIIIGSGGIHPAAEPFTLDPLNPNTHGIAPHNPAVDQGLYVGLVDLGTQRWEMRVSSGPQSTRAYLVVTGTSLSAPTPLGLTSLDLPLRPRLLMNLAAGFQDQTAASGDLDSPLSCVSGAAADFDNDRDMDIYVVCRGGVQNLPDRVFENQGNGVFAEVPGAGGAQGIVGVGLQSGAGTGESVVVADYDLNGFPDVFVTNGANLQPVRVGGPDQLFRNVGNSNRWVELQLIGTVSNPDAIGATVLATAGGVTQLREQNGGYHRWSQHHSYVHFGLAESSTVDLEVHWPSGQMDTFSGVAADALYRVTEGASSENGTIEPVVLGPVPPLPALQAGDECGTPLYSPGIDKKIFLWKDCTSGVWSLRATAGGSAVNVRYEGDVNSDQPFSGVTPFSLEGGDILNNTTPTLIHYRLNMSLSSQDGFNFQFPAGANVCLSVATPPGAQVLVGPLHKIAPLPFNLTTLQSCGIS